MGCRVGELQLAGFGGDVEYIHFKSGAPALRIWVLGFGSVGHRLTSSVLPLTPESEPESKQEATGSVALNIGLFQAGRTV